MSYVPATAVKNGVTLNLANVDWQVTGTDLVGEVLAPSSFQAVATYTGKAYYKAADGYITTAEYVGEISRDGLESITYQVLYLGEETAAGNDAGGVMRTVMAGWPYALGGGALLAVVVLAVLLLRSRREVSQLRADSVQPEDAEYEEDEKE